MPVASCQITLFSAATDISWLFKTSIENEKWCHCWLCWICHYMLLKNRNLIDSVTLLPMGYLKILMLEIALAKSGVTPSWKQIDDLLPSSPLAVYSTVLKYKFRVARLLRKRKTWFSEGRKSSFSYRFTGKETKIFCHKFVCILRALSSEIQPWRHN